MNFDTLANEMIQRRFDPSQIQTKLEMSKTNKTEHMILYYLYMFQGKKSISQKFTAAVSNEFSSHCRYFKKYGSRRFAPTQY